MSRGFNYSKWDNIELSDDESDLHPNIDKESWFRMKHRSRLEREDKEDAEVKEYNKLTAQDETRINILKTTISKVKNGGSQGDDEVDDLEALEGELQELTNNISKRSARIEEINTKRAWNIDNICKTKEEKTVVNKNKAASLKAADFEGTGESEEMLSSSDGTSESVFTKTEAASKSKDSTLSSTTIKSSQGQQEQQQQQQQQQDKIRGPVVAGPTRTNKDKSAVMSYNDYVLSKEDILETFSEIEDMERTKEYLFKHCDVLLHEHSQSYMLLSCLEDEMNGKTKRMKLVCRQSQILSHIQELAGSMKRDPRDVVLPFFHRLEQAEHFNGFKSSVDEFIVKIKKRAVEKRAEMDREREAEAPPLGPGGLDPREVMAVLPAPLREAFESQDVAKLHEVIAAMDPSECRKYMKMCVDSGLWVSKDPNEFDDDAAEGSDEEIA